MSTQWASTKTRWNDHGVRGWPDPLDDHFPLQIGGELHRPMIPVSCTLIPVKAHRPIALAGLRFAPDTAWSPPFELRSPESRSPRLRRVSASHGRSSACGWVKGRPRRPWSGGVRRDGSADGGRLGRWKVEGAGGVRLGESLVASAEDTPGRPSRRRLRFSGESSDRGSRWK